MDVEHQSAPETHLNENDVQYFCDETTIIVDETNENLPADDFYSFYDNDQNFASSKSGDVVVDNNDDIIEESLEYYQFAGEESTLEQPSNYVNVRENEVSFIINMLFSVLFIRKLNLIIIFLIQFYRIIYLMMEYLLKRKNLVTFVIWILFHAHLLLHHLML